MIKFRWSIILWLFNRYYLIDSSPFVNSASAPKTDPRNNCEVMDSGNERYWVQFNWVWHWMWINWDKISCILNCFTKNCWFPVRSITP